MTERLQLPSGAWFVQRGLGLLATTTMPYEYLWESDYRTVALDIGVGADLKVVAQRCAELEAIVVELGGVGALPIECEKSAVARMATRLGELEHHNALLLAVAKVAAQLEPDLARLFAGPLLRALEAARRGGALKETIRGT